MAVGATQTVNSVTQTTNSTSVINEAQILGKDDFFKLLITQLKYQDPMEPLKDTEFIAQMANFSALEQMNNLNNQFKEFSNAINNTLMPNIMLQQATSLIGTEIEYATDSEVLQGVVSSVRLENGIPLLMVDNNKVQLSDVLSIKPYSMPDDNAANVEALLSYIQALESYIYPTGGRF